jgi:general secretion pathway protein H
MTRLGTKSRSAAGMTLIEMMVVTLIMALVMTGLSLGLGSLTRQRLRSSALSVAAAVRTAYGRAAATGHTVRLVIDLDSHSFWAEEAEGGRVLLSADDNDEPEDEDEAEGEETSGGFSNASSAGVQADLMSQVLGADPSQLLSMAQGAAEGELGAGTDTDFMAKLTAAGSDAAKQLEGQTPRYRVPRFEPLKGRLGRKNGLEKGVVFASVMSEHRDHPAEEGRAALYFFPRGTTELAVVQLRDVNGFVNSVEVHPLTGRCRIHNVPYEAPTNEEDLNEAEEAF